MKKLIMWIVVAVLAVAAQAAYVDWTASSLTDYKSGTFMLFDASKSSDVLTALGAVDGTTAATLEGMALTTGTVSTKGKASAAGVDVGSPTSVMAIVFKGDIADGTTYKTITENIAGMTFTPPASSPGNFTSTLATAGTVGTMVKAGGGGDVPEPTSGLLLLVGGAMLALRRKQK